MLATSRLAFPKHDEQAQASPAAHAAASSAPVGRVAELADAQDLKSCGE